MLLPSSSSRKSSKYSRCSSRLGNVKRISSSVIKLRVLPFPRSEIRVCCDGVMITSAIASFFETAFFIFLTTFFFDFCNKRASFLFTIFFVIFAFLCGTCFFLGMMQKSAFLAAFFTFCLKCTFFFINKGRKHKNRVSPTLHLLVYHRFSL